MKKQCIILIMVLIFLVFSSCNSTDDTDTLKDGSYVMKLEDVKMGISPCVTIKNGILSFYDLLNSNSTYGVSGTYIIDDGVLTMTTDDNETYVFLIDGDNLLFQKKDSSSANAINDRFGDTIEDNAKFYLISG